MTREKRIAVVGAGAIGLLYATCLAAARRGEVTLISRRATSAQSAMPATVLGITSITIHAHLAPVTPESAVLRMRARFDVVLVAVAAYDTAAVAPQIAALLVPDGLCISMQNGLDNRRLLSAAINESRVIQGATTFAAHLTDPLTVRVNNAGMTSLPALPHDFGWLTEWLQAAHLHPVSAHDPEQLAWTKIATGSIGYICIILSAPAGQLRHSAGVRAVCEEALLETIALAHASGVSLDRAQLVAQQRRVWETLDDDTRASLYTSFMTGRKTELDDRLGGLLRRAAELGVATPVLACLHALAAARLELRQAPGDSGAPTPVAPADTIRVTPADTSAATSAPE